jgi:hypothetical protein
MDKHERSDILDDLMCVSKNTEHAFKVKHSENCMLIALSAQLPDSHKNQDILLESYQKVLLARASKLFNKLMKSVSIQHKFFIRINQQLQLIITYDGCVVVLESDSKSYIYIHKKKSVVEKHNLTPRIVTDNISVHDLFNSSVVIYIATNTLKQYHNYLNYAFYRTFISYSTCYHEAMIGNIVSYGKSLNAAIKTKYHANENGQVDFYKTVVFLDSIYRDLYFRYVNDIVCRYKTPTVVHMTSVDIYSGFSIYDVYSLLTQYYLRSGFNYILSVFSDILSTTHAIYTILDRMERVTSSLSGYKFDVFETVLSHGIRTYHIRITFPIGKIIIRDDKIVRSRVHDPLGKRSHIVQKLAKVRAYVKKRHPRIDDLLPCLALCVYNLID